MSLKRNIENLFPLYEYIEAHLYNINAKKENIIKFQKAFEDICIEKKYLDEEIKHALEVAIIVANEIKLGSTSIISSILHQFPEKNISYKELLENKYGSCITDIITGVNKIKAIKDYRNLKKISLSFIGDIRILLVRLAEKLAVMRKINFLNCKEQYKIIIETKYIYLPLTNRLGLDKINSELEDLCLKFLNPNIYYTIAKKLILTKNQREHLLDKFIEPLEIYLKRYDIDFSIIRRTKSIASIWNKIKKRGIPFKEVYDLSALRIILNIDLDIEKEKEMCWKTFEIIKKIYKIKDNRTRDWITNPKPNGYEALHLTVVNKKNYWAEIQIRSKKMNEMAERGIAAHWKYKNDEIARQNIPGIQKWMDNIKILIENNKMQKVEESDFHKLSLNKNEICVLGENELAIKFPGKSTLLDFAFEVDKEKAIFCIGGKVNHKIIPLNQHLENGDTIELLFSDHIQINEVWTHFVNTQKAKEMINSFLQQKILKQE